MLAVFGLPASFALPAGFTLPAGFRLLAGRGWALGWWRFPSC